MSIFLSWAAQKKIQKNPSGISFEIQFAREGVENEIQDAVTEN